MLVGVPLAAALYASAESAQCEAVPAPYMPHVLRAAPEAVHRLLMSRSLDALAEEVLTVLRALYLLLLFLPVCATAPMCVGLGVHRDQWIQLMRWTLERAGAQTSAIRKPSTARLHYKHISLYCCCMIASVIGAERGTLGVRMQSYGASDSRCVAVSP